MLSAALTDAYLNRLGFDGPVRVTPEGLADLHEAHLRTVPFENLSIHLGEPIELDKEALVCKLLSGRGGFCYELNGAFAALLGSLGFGVTMLSARVHGDSGLGIPFDHMTLRVDLDTPWLADVGFGENFLRPLQLDDEDEQLDPAGTYRVVRIDDGERDLIANGVPQYRFSLQARRLDEFADGARHHSTSPESHFTQNTVCTLVTPTGRVTLKDRTLITTVDGVKEQQELDDEQVLAAYREHFGISLDGVP